MSFVFFKQYTNISNCSIASFWKSFSHKNGTSDSEKSSIMNGISSQCAKMKMYEGEDDKPIMIKKPLPLRTVSWSDNIEETDLDVPGTPRTPRTSTTKGIYMIQNILKINFAK